ncbi:hypothetical protein BABINDRAFT_161824, partial [Babjeviella inositovora NRRL Y-12698]
MKFESRTLDVGYPIYGAGFISDAMLAVAGGGGEGAHGIPNKLSAVTIDFSADEPLKVQSEVKLSDEEDSAMSLAAGGDTVLLGVNQSSKSITRGENKHVRMYSYTKDQWVFGLALQVSESKDSSEYQKHTVVSLDGVYAAICMSDESGIVTFLKSTERGFTKTYEYKAESDVKDISFGPDGKSVAIVTSKTLTIVAASIGKPTFKLENFGKDSLTKVRFIDDEMLLVGASAKNNGGVLLFQISIPQESVLRRLVVSKKVRGLTSMAVSLDEGLVAFSGSDSSVFLLDVTTLRTIHLFKTVHAFAITKVVFSPSGQYLASTSAANTI